MKKNEKKSTSFESRNVLIIMTIVCMALVALGLTSYVKTGPVHTAAGYLVVPFQKGLNKVGTLISGTDLTLQNVDELLEKNKALQAKVDELTEQNNLLLQEKDAYERLKELYALDISYSEYEKVGANVISKDPGNWYSTFTIDKGTNDGIAVDMNVIAGGGLVGIVTRTGSDWATVRSIIDDASNVSAMAGSTLDTCLVTGNLALMEQGKITFIELTDEKNAINVGEKLITSNISSKFLKGILIGYISDIEDDPSNLTKKGYLVPAADFSHLQEVLVIKNLKITGEEGGES